MAKEYIFLDMSIINPIVVFCYFSTTLRHAGIADKSSDLTSSLSS